MIIGKKKKNLNKTPLTVMDLLLDGKKKDFFFLIKKRTQVELFLFNFFFFLLAKVPITSPIQAPFEFGYISKNTLSAKVLELNL